MRTLALLSTLLLSFAAQAAGPTVGTPTGVSNYSFTKGVFTIYGGIAGDSSNCNGDGVSTCNSCENPTCTTAPLCACNTQQIYNNLVVRIPLKAPHGMSGNAIATIGNMLLPLTTPNNGGKFIDFPWSTICQMMGNADCAQVSSASTVVISVYIDQNHSGVVDTGDSDPTLITFKILKPAAGYDVFGLLNADGLGGFTPYPGDHKVYLVDLQATGGWPTLAYGGTITKLRVFMSDKNMTEAAPMGPMAPKDLPIDNAGDLPSSVVDGLINGKSYVFRVGLVDEAGNVVQFYPGSEANGGTKNCDHVTPPSEDSCAFAATPSQVKGNLSSGYSPIQHP